MCRLRAGQVALRKLKRADLVGVAVKQVLAGLDREAFDGGGVLITAGVVGRGSAQKFPDDMVAQLELMRSR